MSINRLALVAAAAIVAGAFSVGGAAAMPVGGLKSTADAVQISPENVRWVCGPYRCWWRPGPFWGPRPWRHGHRRWW